MWRLIRVCTVCLWLFHGFPGKNGFYINSFMIYNQRFQGQATRIFSVFAYLLVASLLRKTFLTFETEFVLFLAVLENSVLPVG